MARPDLKSMKMPEAKSKKPEMLEDEEMSLDFESAPEGEEAEAFAGEESPAEELAELADISDDDLLKEMKRRGLSMDKAAPSKMEDIDLAAEMPAE